MLSALLRPLVPYRVARQLMSLVWVVVFLRVAPLLSIVAVMLHRLVTRLFTTLSGQRMLSMTWPPLVLDMWATTLGLSLGSRHVRLVFRANVKAARLDGNELEPHSLLHLPLGVLLLF